MLLAMVIFGIVCAYGFDALAARRYPEHMLGLWAAGLVVAALIYVGFAAYAGDAFAIYRDLAGVAGFGAIAWLALKFDARLLSAGWFLHVFWDVVVDTGAHDVAPDWYAALCLGFDLAATLIIWRRARAVPA